MLDIIGEGLQILGSILISVLEAVIGDVIAHVIRLP